VLGIRKTILQNNDCQRQPFKKSNRHILKGHKDDLKGIPNTFSRALEKNEVSLRDFIRHANPQSHLKQANPALYEL
jgi:hypothetical protein